MVTCRALSAGAKSICKQEIRVPRASPPHFPAQDQDLCSILPTQGAVVLGEQEGQAMMAPDHSGGDSGKGPGEEKVKDIGPKKQKRGGGHLELVSLALGKRPEPTTSLQPPPTPSLYLESGSVLPGPSSWLPVAPGRKGAWSAPAPSPLLICIQISPQAPSPPPSDISHLSREPDFLLSCCRCCWPLTTQRGSCCSWGHQPQNHQIKPQALRGHSRSHPSL